MRLPPFPESGVGEICRHVLMGVMPALVERDLAAFGAAISAIQRLVGNYFAPAQGGVFTSETCRRLAHRLAEAGAVGIGQSSWGPTGFAFAPSEAVACSMVGRAQERGGRESNQDRARQERRREDQRDRARPGGARSAA